MNKYLEKFTFEYLIQHALSHVSTTLDKREGSIIYDALAPACYELADYYMNLRKLLIDTFASTSAGQYLDLRVAEQGLSRYLATKATKRGIFTSNNNLPHAISVGSRFSIISEDENVNYIVTEVYIDEDNNVVAGSYKLVCEEFGVIGNSYVGPLIPISHINNLKSAIMTDLIIPARNVETDEELRTRYFQTINRKPFGGNIAQYDTEVKAIDGVGELQIYPVWDGGGTVKLSIVDAQYNPISSEFINIIQNLVDPENNLGVKGDGLGFAPIGHKVTVTTPTELIINVHANVTIVTGYNLPQVTGLIREAIDLYLQDLRMVWGIANDLNQYYLSIYLARISSAILGVAGVDNVTDTLINGSPQDLTLTQDYLLQELPQLGEVVING